MIIASTWNWELKRTSCVCDRFRITNSVPWLSANCSGFHHAAWLANEVLIRSHSESNQHSVEQPVVGLVVMCGTVGLDRFVVRAFTETVPLVC